MKKDSRSGEKELKIGGSSCYIFVFISYRVGALLPRRELSRFLSETFVN